MGGMARYIIEKASAEMIGVNVGVPVPGNLHGLEDDEFGWAKFY